MVELPVPVAIPDDKTRPPPFLSVAPVVAPPAVIVRGLPAVLVVVLRLSVMARAAVPSMLKLVDAKDVNVPAAGVVAPMTPGVAQFVDELLQDKLPAPS